MDMAKMEWENQLGLVGIFYKLMGGEWKDELARRLKITEKE